MALEMQSQLYTNGVIVTVDASRRIILNGSLLVVDRRIAAVGKAHEVETSGLVPENVQRIDLKCRIVIPGLINGHVHLIQSLMRGLAEDLALHDWASCAIWPLEVSYRGEDGAIAARLAIAEMMKSGTTTFLEPMLPSSPDSDFSKIAEAVGESGMRGCLGKLVKVKRSDPSAGIPDSRDTHLDAMSVDAALESHREYHDAFGGRLHVWMAAETPRGQDQRGFEAVGKACRDHKVRLTVHCAEAAKDQELIEKHYQATPAKFCQNIQSTGSHVVLAHMVHLAEQDFAILRETDTSIAHNPTSNAKLADGIAPVPRLLDEGINVCIGSDGAPCNNSHDLFRDMRMAGIVHKALHMDPSMLSAEQILEMATINGARALGIDQDVGSLEVGKKADFAILNHRGLHAAPYDPSELLVGGLPVPILVVHSLSGADVDTVVIDGEVVVKGGQLVSLDEEKIKRDARDAISRIRKVSGVKAQPLKNGWNYV